jgi:chorismate synthase
MLSAAIMSVPAVKGVEIGDGFGLAGKYGSEVHDEIIREKSGRYRRKTNHLGGMEGGMTNGMELVVRAVMKPIPTLMRPLQTVDIETKRKESAAAERSDVCAVPACAVVVEAMTAVTLADAFLRQFGGAERSDIEESYRRYMERIDSF